MLNIMIGAVALAAIAFAGGLYVGLSRAPKVVRDHDLENQLSDEAEASHERAAEAERRMKAMIWSRDPAHMDELALKFAGDVEDYFARSYEGGVTQRRATIQGAAIRLIEDALAGGKPEFN